MTARSDLEIGPVGHSAVHHLHGSIGILGVKVEQVMEAAIPISILTLGLARAYRRRSTILENVRAIFALPALYILKPDPHTVQTTFIFSWAAPLACSS